MAILFLLFQYFVDNKTRIQYDKYFLIKHNFKLATFVLSYIKETVYIKNNELLTKTDRSACHIQSGV